MSSSLCLHLNTVGNDNCYDLLRRRIHTLAEILTIIELCTNSYYASHDIVVSSSVSII